MKYNVQYLKQEPHPKTDEAQKAMAQYVNRIETSMFQLVVFIRPLENYFKLRTATKETSRDDICSMLRDSSSLSGRLLVAIRLLADSGSTAT